MAWYDLGWLGMTWYDLGWQCATQDNMTFGMNRDDLVGWLLGWLGMTWDEAVRLMTIWLLEWLGLESTWDPFEWLLGSLVILGITGSESLVMTLSDLGRLYDDSGGIGMTWNDSGCNNPPRLANKWLQWPLTWDSSWECWDDSQWLGIDWGWLNMPWDSLGMSWDDLGWLRYHLVSVGITHMTDKQLENPALKIILLNKQNQHINPAHKRESTVTDILNTGFRIVYSDIGILDNVISNNLWYKVRVDSGNWWTDQHDSMTPCIKTADLHLRLGTGQRIQESGSVVTAEIMLSLLMKGLEPFEPIGPLNWSTKKKNSTNWEMVTKWERMCLWHKLMTDWWEESKKRTWQDGEIVLLQWVNHSYVAIAARYSNVWLPLICLLFWLIDSCQKYLTIECEDKGLKQVEPVADWDNQ